MRKKLSYNANWWIFTFGVGHEQYGGHFVKIYGTFDNARSKMVKYFGRNWSCQYSEDEWNGFMQDKERRFPLEVQAKDNAGVENNRFDVMIDDGSDELTRGDFVKEFDSIEEAHEYVEHAREFLKDLNIWLERRIKFFIVDNETDEEIWDEE